jgi:hypothetical protein
MLLAIVALLAATPAGHGPPKDPPRPPTEVEGITVMPPTPAPKLVASFPAEGEAVAPGALVLRLTFDQRMLPNAFDVVPTLSDGLDCVKRPRLLNDDKTFVLLCTARAGRTYSVSLNGAAASGGFANLGEHRADPVKLTFSTTRDEPIRNLAEAMKVAKLTGLDVPVAESP